jgi:PAS domain S-box-containing protein
MVVLFDLQSVYELTHFQSFKGIFFILFTTLLLFLLIGRSTKQLKSSEIFYKSYFTHNPNPMWIIDPVNHRILTVNEAALQFYGYTEDEFISLSVKDLRPEEEVERYIQLSKTGSPGINTSGPVKHIKKNKEIIYVEVYAYLTTRKGEKVAFVMVVDVTQRIHYQQQVTELNRTLEQKVAERTSQYLDKNYALEVANRELTSLNEELTTANDKLAAANEVITRQSDLLIKQSEEKLNGILNTIQDVVWSASFPDRKLSYINQAAEQIFGFTPEELYNNSYILEQVVYSEDKSMVGEAFKELVNNKYIQAEYRITHKSGAIRWIRNQVWLTPTAGQPTLMDGVVTDITERKNYETELLKRQSLLNSFIESQTSYLIRTDIEGNYTFANQQFYKKFGYLPEEIIGKSFARTILEDDVEACQAMAWECIQHPGKIVPLIIRKPGKGNEMFWTEWEFIGIQDEAGKVVEIQGVGQDITDRKRYEEKLEESTHALKEAQQVAQIGNWAWDLATGTVNWSDQVFAIHHLSQDKGVPDLEQLLSFYHPDDVPILQAAIQAAVGQALPYNLDLRIMDPISHEIIYVNLIGKPATHKNGLVTKLYGTILNINERKLFEQNLQHQNEQLKKINAELDRFVYSVSHSLRAPLTSVLGLVNVIRINEVDAQLNMYLGLMEKSILKLDETIHEINNYSRNARLGLNITEVNLPKLLHDLSVQYTSADGKAKVNIDTALEANVPLYTDAERLRVVFNNLVSNAVKYCDTQKPITHVLVKVNVSKEEALIEVEDNGMGIEASVIDKVFNMFFRASERSTGSGLGLYIVKETVEKLKGKISVTSDLGKGTTFHIRILNMHE